MWIPGSGETQALSEARDDRPLLRPCHHKHVAVCQQETLAFIELQPPVTPKINGQASPKSSLLDTKHSLFSLDSLNNSVNGAQNGNQRNKPDRDTGTDLSFDAQSLGGDDEFVTRNNARTDSSKEKPLAVSTVCRPLYAALSLPLTLPLSSLYRDRDSWDSQLPGSPPSPEGPGFQSPDTCQPQRRTSQGSLKEKSIRKCRVHSYTRLHQHATWISCQHVQMTLQILSASNKCVQMS